jgi:hypothetical protein
MTEQEALRKSTGFVNYDGLIGYLPFRAANELVRSGRYVWHQCCAWGYVVKKHGSLKLLDLD